MRHFPTFAIFLLPFFFLVDGCHPIAKAPTPNVAAPQTATTPVPPLRSPSGRLYARTRIGPADNDEPVISPAVQPGGASTDDYRGTARETAKLSVASGSPQTFTDLGAVLDSLSSDAQMRAKHISEAANSGRLPEEQTIVVVRAFLYASSHESDNDFHCIVGSDPGQPTRFMNVEVSGLPQPRSRFFDTLKTARDEFKAFFTSGGDALPRDGYEKYDPPIPIQLTGSVFFDVDHVAPSVGPEGMKPLTAWEIHPVSDIEFEPQP